MTTCEPVAVVGLSCRLPGAPDVESFWRLLSGGTSAITESSRFGDTGTVRWGGYLADEEVGTFDAEFFGISPKEAAAMDPQQRLLLELGWEAFENAGVAPETVRGGNVGVFIGAIAADYLRIAAKSGAVSRHSLTGLQRGLLANRLSYVLGVHGPSLAVDTGQSSSLVAVHLACESLRSGESSVALAGGVNLILTPDSTVEADTFGALSPDGRCFTFDSRANGYVRGEGGVVLVLKPLSVAVRDGDCVYAVIRGSAVNSGGAAETLTTPSQSAQEAVVSTALSRAGVAASEVSFVEMHGTGTPLGDPIEAAALGTVLGSRRAEPLRVGSVKTNIGHLEGAAGIAGLLKVVLALHHGAVPPSLNFVSPNPAIALDALNLCVQQSLEPVGPTVAGVSSWGVGGTNCHVVVGSAQPPKLSDLPEMIGMGGVSPQGAGNSESIPHAAAWVLSARSEAALRDQAARLHEHTLTTATSAADIGFSLASTRSMFDHRAVVVGTRAELLDGLRAISDDTDATNVVRGTAKPQHGKTVFVFPGQGGQWTGMARELLDTSPTFAAMIDRCARGLAPYLDWSLHDVLRDAPGAPSMDRGEIAHPALWAINVALAHLWISAGVRPDAVIGHSQGEVAAAVISGALTVEEGARTIALRSRTTAHIQHDGSMASVPLPVDEVDLSEWGHRLEIGAINGPQSTIVSGDREALLEMIAGYQAAAVNAKELRVAFASHSWHVEGLHGPLSEALHDLRPRPADITFYSTITTRPLDTTLLTADYWYDNLRETVRFEGAVRTALGDGCTTFIEISGHPVLTFAMGQVAPDAVVTGTLRRDQGGLGRFYTSLAAVHVAGGRVEWPDVLTGNVVPLPTYPFQRKRFWLDAPASAGNVSAAGLEPARHPLLGAVMEFAGGCAGVMTGRLSWQSHPWLADHALFGRVVVPGSVFADMVWYAAEWVGAGAIDLTLDVPLVLDDSGAQIQVVVSEEVDGVRPVSVHSRVAEDEWTRHAHGSLHTVDDLDPQGIWPPQDEWPPIDATELDVDALYDRLLDAGIELGPAFRGVRGAWAQRGVIFADIAVPEDAPAGDAFGLHPVLLDAMLQPVGTEKPFSWQGLRLWTSGAAELRVRIAPAADGVEISATTPDGLPVLQVESVRSRPMSADELESARTARPFRVTWHEIAAPVADCAATTVGLDGFDTLADVPEYVLLDTSARSPGSVVEEAHELTVAVLALVQEWLADARFAASTLVVLTRHAIAAGDEDVVDLGAAPLWGLVRTAQAEHPDRIVLLDVSGDDSLVPAALASGEAQLAVRDGKVLVPRLATGSAGAPVTFDPEGTVLVTGGELGALVARHLVSRYGVKHVLLVSRTGETACDVADPAQLSALLASLDRPLAAVVHTAGVLADGTVSSLSAEQVREVLRPKVDAAWNLHRATSVPLILFSSAVGVIGNPGQANYAAANTFLDALAHHRRAAGLPAVSMAWTPWADTGISAALTETALARLAERGVVPMSVEVALAHFDAALGADALAVTGRLDARDVDVPVLRGLQRARPRRAPVKRSITAELAGLGADEQHAVLLDLVSRTAAGMLGHDSPDAIAPLTGFLKQGFDSLSAVELQKRLSKIVDLQLPSTLTFDYPTPDAMASYLRPLLAREESSADVLGELSRLRAVLTAAVDDPAFADREAVVTALNELMGLVDVEYAIDTQTADDDFFAMIEDELA